MVTQSDAAVTRRGVAQTRPWFTATLFLAYAAGLGMHWLHRDQHERTDIAPVLHWLRDSSLAIPLALAAVVLAYVVLDSLSLLPDGPHQPRVMAHATLAAVFYALGSIPGALIHARLFGAEHQAVHREGHGTTHVAGVAPGWEHLSRDAWAALLFGVTALLLHAAATELTRRIRRQAAPDDEPRADSVTARPR